MRALAARAVGLVVVAMVPLLWSCAPRSSAPESSAPGPAAEEPSRFAGTWSGYLTTQEDPYWVFPDVICFPGCPALLREQILAALADPANGGALNEKLWPAIIGATVADRESRSTPEGLARIKATSVPGSVDPAAYCNPYGFVRESLNALPMTIREEGDRLVFQYEEFGLHRDIWMDGRGHPAGLAPTPMGHSVGRYEDGTLVIDTVAISADQLVLVQSPNIWWGGFADGSSAVERYTVEENPRRLVVTLTLTDPVTLTKPYDWTKTWLSTPDVDLIEDSCEEVPGQL